jgi:Flp pilus assembly protein TadB
LNPSQTELPRAVRRGPPITLTCECGEQHQLRYGERWKCERCGRTWDTNQIPIDDYAAIRRTQLRMRRVPIAITVLSLACVITFIALGKAFGGLILVAFAATAWSMFLRPLHKRRYRKELAKLPTWEIKPD